MGGDQLVAALTGDQVERRLGDALRAVSAEEFERLRDECAPLEGGKELIAELKQRGLVVVLASSSRAGDLDHFLDELDVRGLVDGWTTADDVDRTKPQPDVIEAALERAGTSNAVMIGDSRWDIEAARRAGLPTVCVITGGWSEQELRDHGAVSVFESLIALRAGLDETPFKALSAVGEPPDVESARFDMPE
jgi:HAD superfamily hydrolase (TIGR01549 family)